MKKKSTLKVKNSNYFFSIKEFSLENNAYTLKINLYKGSLKLFLNRTIN